MSDFVVMQSAERDLGEIWEFIANDNPSAANGLESQLFGAFQSLADHPSLGHRRSDLTHFDYHFFSVRQYIIIYDAAATPLRIIRVLHAARDIQNLLDEPED